MMTIPYKRVVVKCVLVSFLLLCLQSTVSAAIISTDSILSQQAESAQKLRLMNLLQRDDVRVKLIDMGVSPEDAAQRVATLTDREAAQFADEIEQMPAGGDFLGTAVFVFLVLLVTDILGYTDIFPFVVKKHKRH